MSDETVPGALIAIGTTVFFVPKDDLDTYRVPDAAADEALGAFGDEVAGFGEMAAEETPSPRVILAKYTPPTTNYGTTWQFPLTLSRMCYRGPTVCRSRPLWNRGARRR